VILSASSPTPRRTALGFGLAAIALSGAEAQAGAAYAPEPRRAEAGHVMLLGDSVFDNAAYVAGGPDVVRQVRARLPGGWRATLAARDGATTADVPAQLARVPPDASRLVVSAGGNDALREQGMLAEPVRSVAEALDRLAATRARFERAYHALTLREVQSFEEEGALGLRLMTDAGAITCRLHPASGDAAILWVFGAGGGLNGPAGGLYPRLARRFQPLGVASLELAYRHPGRLDPCVADVRLGIAHLAVQGKGRIVLAGHFFGRAVVIAAGAASPEVVAVAALSSQTSGTGAVGALSLRPLLLMHGGPRTRCRPPRAPRTSTPAREPKRIVLYPGCRHGLDECREALDRDLTAWVQQVTGAGPTTECECSRAGARPLRCSKQRRSGMNDKTQASSRKDGFGTANLGDDGDESLGETGTSSGGTGATSHGGKQRGAVKAEGATGEEDGSIGLHNQANKQGIQGGGTQQD